MNTDIESLRRWGQILLWISIVLPSLGAVAVAARYYVERQEKRLSTVRSEEAIRAAREQAAAANVVASEAQRAQAEIKAELGRSQQALEDLQVKTAPRHLSAGQRAALLKAIGSRLKGKPIAFASKFSDGESADFATDLATTFKQAECVVPALIQTSLNDSPGALVIVSRGNADQHIVSILATAFAAANIPAQVGTVPEGSIGSWYNDVVHVIVGRKRTLHALAAVTCPRFPYSSGLETPG